MRTKVYISGPITKGDRERNLQQAMDAHLALLTAGFAPICPHLTMLLPHAWTTEHGVWIECDLPWVAVADALLRLPGESAGAEAECDFAFECGVPVFSSLWKLVEHFNGKAKASEAA